MPIYDSKGISASYCYDKTGASLTDVYDISGNIHHPQYAPSTPYEQALFNAMQDWQSKRTASIVPLIVHSDQHTYLRNNPIFSKLSDMGAVNGISACLNLGDVTDYNVSNFQAMAQALSYIPKNKQINLWGNHETWIRQIDMTPPYRTVTAEELAEINTYFDNSEYGIQHTYNDYGIQYLIDNTNKIKYVVLSGWEYDTQLGSYNYYVIGSQSMDSLISMLSTVDNYDIVIISHIQPYCGLYSSSLWTHPPVEPENPQGGGGSMSYNVVCTATNVHMDDLLNARKNKTSGTIADSYGNIHTFDFSSCTSDLLCCLAGHEHIDKYSWGNNGTIPVYIFDGYGFDNHPIYYLNIDKSNKYLDVWKIDDSPTVYNFQIPFAKPNS